MALASLLARDAARRPRRSNPLAPKPPHFRAKAKSVIYLFMAGGPSQLELFDPSRSCRSSTASRSPSRSSKGKRFAFMDTFTKERPKLLGTAPQVRPARPVRDVGLRVPAAHRPGSWTTWPSSGRWRPNVFNHGPAKLFVNTGSPQFGRPSMGSWVTYGIGSESTDLPGFVVLQSGPRGPRGGAALWSSGFLPTTYQGVPFRSGGEPILNLSSPGRRVARPAEGGDRRGQAT